MFIVQIFEHLFTGDGYHRVSQPARALGRRDDVLFVDCHHEHSRLYELALQCDVLLTQHFGNLHLFDLIEERRRRNKVTVFETADDYQHAQPWNPVAQALVDPDVLLEHGRYVAAADAVQTSTTAVADIWRTSARKIVVFENHIADLAPLAPPREGSITIGWAGSQGHLADWYHATRYLQPWLEAHPEVQVAVMSHELARNFMVLPPERYRFVATGGMPEYLQFLSTIDIGLAPLLPIDWNRTRSDVKFLEYAACGVVGLYSNLGPYQSVKPDECGLLFGTPAEMLAALDRVVADAALRDKLRTNAYAYVRSERLLSTRVHERYDFYSSLLNGPPADVRPSDEVLEGAYREHNYVQLDVDEHSRALRALRGRPTTTEVVIALAEIARNAPSFVSAQLTLGRMLNDLRQPEQATGVLTRALEQVPFSVELTAELGRARAQAKDFDGAHRALCGALQTDSHHVLSWHYLLGLLRLAPSADAPILLSRLDELHPLHYQLQLKALSLYPEHVQPARLEALIERLRSKFSPSQLSALLPELSRALQQWCTPRMHEAAVRELINRCRSYFPHSPALVTLAGLVARMGGNHEQAATEFQLAASLYRSSQVCRGEGGEALYLNYYGLIAEQIAALEREGAI